MALSKNDKKLTIYNKCIERYEGAKTLIFKNLKRFNKGGGVLTDFAGLTPGCDSEIFFSLLSV